MHEDDGKLFFAVPFLVVSFLQFFFPFAFITLICLQVSISSYLDLQNDRVKGRMLTSRFVTVPGGVFPSLSSLSWFRFPSHGTSFREERMREDEDG